MPSPIQLPGPTQALVRSLGLVGRFPLSVDEMVAPVVVLSDLAQEGPQPLIRRAAARLTVVGVVGEVAVYRFETPNGTGARIRELYLLNLTAAVAVHVFFGSAIVAPINVAAKAFMDGRLRAAGQSPAGVLTGGTQVGGFGVIHSQLPCVAAPGSLHAVDWRIGRVDAFDFVEFKVDLANSTCTFAMIWDEYEIR